MSEANRASLKSIAETTYGTTPAAAGSVWQDMRYASHNLASNPQTQVSDEIRSDRMVTDLNKVGEQVNGDVGCEFSLETYNEWLEALLCGTWTGSPLSGAVLKNGTQQRSFSLEVAHEDWSPIQYLQFKGMRIGAASFNWAYGSIATCNFSFAGKQSLQSTTSLLLDSTSPVHVLTAKTATDVVNGSSDITGLLVDGSSPGSVIRSISLNIDNTLRPIEGVGSVGPQNQAYGRSRVTGQIEMYFDDIALYTKLLANTAARLQWTVDDGTTTLAFDLRAVKLTSGIPAVQGVDTDVMVTFDYEAIYNATDDASITLTRGTS